MPCQEATGSCSITPDGDCIEPKEYNPSLTPLTDVYISGTDTSFTIEWNVAVSRPTQAVKLRYRIDSSVDLGVRTEVDRDDGTLTVDSGLTTGVLYLLWLRPETDTEYGDWQQFIAITDVGWDSDSETVIFAGETVLHLTDVVIYS